MTPDEIRQIGDDIAAALYAKGREVVREAHQIGASDEFLRDIEVFFMLAAQTAVLRALRLAALSRLPQGGASDSVTYWRNWFTGDEGHIPQPHPVHS